MNTLFDLTGKIAMVTGSSTGLGQGMSLGFASAGADLVLVDRVESDETAGVIMTMGRRAVSLVADLSSMEQIRKVVSEAIAAFGKVDILVNNAGTTRRTPAIDFSETDWEDHQYRLIAEFQRRNNRSVIRSKQRSGGADHQGPCQ